MLSRSISIFYLLGALLSLVLGSPGSQGLVRPRRTSSILIDPDEQPELPPPSEAESEAAGAALNLSDIQGDILIGMKKNQERFFFFHIEDPPAFKQNLRSKVDLITSTSQLLDVSKQPNAMVNIAFSYTGLLALNVTETTGDFFFEAGMFSAAFDLGDPGTDDWIPAFKGTNIHGVFLLASDSQETIEEEWEVVKKYFNSSITEIYTLSGQARPGDQQGHEHFGFMDGISNPAVRGFNKNPLPGQMFIDVGRVLLGEPGDELENRPVWAKDGSFLAFRQLEQLVPEFNKFIAENALSVPGLTLEEGAELLGARMVGRWKSGAPVFLSPLRDDPTLAKDPMRNNDFNFTWPGEDALSNQTRCPFSAHIRKTAPRADFVHLEIDHHIFRAGIPYGPEVTPEEATSNTTQTERGLAFVAYQSDLAEGFITLQKRWASDPEFVHNKSDSTPGYDPIVGANHGEPRLVSGLDPIDPTRDFTLMTDFVRSRGGEYFFIPAISAVRDYLTAP